MKTTVELPDDLVKEIKLLAVHEGKPMGMTHIKRVLDVADDHALYLEWGVLSEVLDA